MRVAAVADLHGLLPAVPPCDLLLLAGDLCPVHDHGVAFQARWLDTDFRAWLETVPAGAIAGIAGNHDFVFEQAPELVPLDLPWTYLEQTTATVAGLTVWGSPWTPWFHDWAFNAPRDPAAGEAFLAERYATAPDDADVLLLHGPPRGHGGRTVFGVDAGAQAALDLVDRVRPRLCAFGHIHEGRGGYDRDGTALVNVSAVDAAYAPYPDPVVLLEIEPRASSSGSAAR
jgi:predicted phosphohydrolase